MTIENDDKDFVDDVGDDALLDAELEETDGPEADDEDEGDEPEAKADETDSQEDGGQPKRKNTTVPHAAFHQERLRRQNTERELAQIKHQFETFNQRLEDMRRAADEAENAPPDPEQDPIGALKYQQQQLMQQRQREQETARETAERQQQEAAIRQIDTVYRQSWESVRTDNPNSQQAYEGFISALDRHFQARGVYDPTERQTLINNEERAIAYAAMQQGRDPASVIIDTYGAQIAAETKLAVNAQEVIERRQRATSAARSLSNAGGKSGDEAITAQRIADMSIDEYEAWRSKATPAQLRKFLGG